MRLVRNVFYLSGALIGTGVLLYFVLGLVSAASLGGFHVARGSLPGPVRLAQGGTYAITPDCSMTLVGTAGLFPNQAYARIKVGSLGNIVSAYGVGDRVRCSNYPDRSILAMVDAIDVTGAHFVFQWGP